MKSVNNKESIDRVLLRWFQRHVIFLFVCNVSEWWMNSHSTTPTSLWIHFLLHLRSVTLCSRPNKKERSGCMFVIVFVIVIVFVFVFVFVCEWSNQCGVSQQLYCRSWKHPKCWRKLQRVALWNQQVSHTPSKLQTNFLEPKCIKYFLFILCFVLQHISQNFLFLIFVVFSNFDNFCWQDALISNTLDVIHDYMSVYSYSIAFPELAIPCVVALKKFAKRCHNGMWRRKVKALLESVRKNQSHNMTNNQSVIVSFFTFSLFCSFNFLCSFLCWSWHESLFL
jgi:hypothetical protein